MRTVGKIIMILGFLAFASSVLNIFYCAYYAFNKRLLVEEHVNGLTYESPLVDIETQKHLLITVIAEVESSSASPYSGVDGYSGSYSLNYLVPVEYQVINAVGEVIFRQKDKLTHDSSKDNPFDESSRYGGRAGGEFSFEKIKVTESPISLKVLFRNDYQYQSSLTNARIRLYDNALPYTNYLVTAAILFLIGFFLLFVGIVFVLVPESKTVVVKRVRGDDTSEGSESTLNGSSIGALVHLSSLSGFIIPLGGLIGPLIVWLVSRNKGKFIDEHGREVVNFRISMLIYYTLATLLCLILIGFLILTIFILIDIICTIIAAFKASQGKHYRYPMNMRILKPD